MKKLIVLIFILSGLAAFAQIDTDELSLNISKAEGENFEQLKPYIWKRVAVTTVDGAEKLHTMAEVKFNEEGDPEVTMIDADTDVKQKRGIRGKIQANTVESNMEYVQEALKLALAYTYMSKGQLLDFFDKAEITEGDGVIMAAAKNIFMEGDSLEVVVDKETLLFKDKKFFSFTGKDKDPVSGEIMYEAFSNGVVHPSGSILNMPEKGATIVSKNQDYTIRVQ